MKKIRFFATGLLMLPVFAVNVQTAGEIALPDVSTVIGTENSLVGNEYLPDFEDIASLPEKSDALNPELPAQNEKQPSGNEFFSPAEDRSSYAASAEVGGGFPGLFLGDFSVVRFYGTAPFKVGFKHNSAAGYVGNPLSAGYNDRNTQVFLDKSYNKDSFKLNFGGDYETTGDGLQGRVEDISDLNRNTVSAHGSFEWLFPNHISLGTNLDALYYSRYVDISADAGDCADWVAEASVASGSPLLFLAWNDHGFDLRLSGQYQLDFDTTGSISSQSNPFYTGHTNNRGEFKFSAQWQNTYVTLSGAVAAVVGNQLGGHDVLAPFGLAFKGKFPVYYSNRELLLDVSGGLDSRKNDISELEKTYKFTGFSFIPTETSSWYGALAVSVPIQTFFYADAKAEYRRTAFNNGFWEPSYTASALYNGVYDYVQNDLQLLATEFKLIFNYKMLLVWGGWKSNWLDVPVIENRHVLSSGISVQNAETDWSVSLSASLALDADDRTPELELSGFVHITPSVILRLSAEDILKLVSNQVRYYAGQYAQRSGTASLSIKFFF